MAQKPAGASIPITNYGRNIYPSEKILQSCGCWQNLMTFKFQNIL